VTLRLGFAGLGVGAGMFLRSIEQEPNVEVVAAAEVRPQALETFVQRYGGRTYDTVEALCADPDVDVVWIATPNHLHREHALLAASHGKHIICTKPMALTVAECAEMCEAAERNGVALLCGQTYSMSSDIQAMAQVAASGRLGRVIAITMTMSADWLLKPRVAEELDESLGGGVLYRHGPHLVDTARVLAGGRLRSVRGSVGRWMPERPCAGNF
jgi:phthalate 4,5-cis-dihydrodiol dehydrogenase